MRSFRDRADAGRQLGEQLKTHIATHQGPPAWRSLIVLALPRGGVPVGAEVAVSLGATMDVIVARKVGAPFQPEFGIGAIAEGGVAVMDARSVAAVGLDRHRFDELAELERVELDRRVRRYRGDRPLPGLNGRTAIIVDDGLATGVTAHAAVDGVRALGGEHVVVAAPVSSVDAFERLRGVADDMVCVLVRRDLHSVGEWYARFDQTTDEEVIELLARF